MTATIAFDGGVLAAGPITGVGRSFLHALTAYARADSARVILLLPEVAEDPAIAGVETMRTRAVAGPVARRVLLPRLLRRIGADVLHTPVAAIPLGAPCPVVATLHDLPWRANTPLREAGTRLRARLAARVALDLADVVVVPSSATRADAIAWRREPRAEVTVVPHGVPLPRVEEGVPRDGPFLVVSDDRPRKNLARLHRAHDRAARMRPDLPPIERIGPDCRFVPEDEKHHLLRRARALLFVSLHEGFGLPVIEAFGHGTPVLCSDRKSLPEVAGDAALIVDPEDEYALAEAIVRIHEDEPLRERLARTGRARAAEFTPDRTAAHWNRIHARLAG